MNTNLAKLTHEDCLACEVARTSGARFCPQCGRALTLASVEASSPDIGLRQESLDRSDSRTATDAELDITVLKEAPPVETQECSPVSAPKPPEVCPQCGHEAESALRLVRAAGDNDPTGLRLGETPIIIGKDETCDVVIATDDFVSRKHARVSLDQGLCYLEDLGSSNGTLLKIRRPVVIEPGDEILVGSTLFRLEGSPRSTV